MEKSVRITGKKVNIKLVLSNIHLYSDTLPWNLLDNNYTKTHFRDDGYKNTNGAMSKSKKEQYFGSQTIFSQELFTIQHK